MSTHGAHSELDQADQNQDRGQPPEDHLTAKRQREVSKDQPSGEHKPTTKIDRNGPAKGDG